MAGMWDVEWELPGCLGRHRKRLPEEDVRGEEDIKGEENRST